MDKPALFISINISWPWQIYVWLKSTNYVLNTKTTVPGPPLYTGLWCLPCYSHNPTAVVLSSSKGIWQSLRSLQKDCRVKRAALSSSTLMCCSLSSSVQFPPVTWPLQVPPQPRLEAPEYSTKQGFPRWIVLAVCSMLSLHHSMSDLAFWDTVIVASKLP